MRHRLSDDGSVRHTTVELLIESTPIASRARTLVAVKIGHADKHTRSLLMACGAQWVSREQVWLLPRMVAKNLRLLNEIMDQECASSVARYALDLSAIGATA